jgi:hypothetical protein
MLNVAAADTEGESTSSWESLSSNYLHPFARQGITGLPGNLKKVNVLLGF